MIIGYEHGSGFACIGRLLLAARKSGGLVYVGGVGTGSSATELRKQMDQIATSAPAVDTGKKRPNVTGVRPELVAEIEFRAWTDDGKLRHASFKGVRDAADAGAIYEI